MMFVGGCVAFGDCVATGAGVGVGIGLADGLAVEPGCAGDAVGVDAVGVDAVGVGLLMDPVDGAGVGVGISGAGFTCRSTTPDVALRVRPWTFARTIQR
jgi:hypothetical protein